MKRLTVAAPLASAKGDDDGLVALIQGLEPELRDGLLYGLARCLVGVTDQLCEAKGAADPRVATIEAFEAEALELAGE
ncbi:hypothetical protein [Streptomyces sp. NPDC058653]|uniref:hypothetical protein n=1 Tax=Streptomyces sp. NPDC058653 TaxID=3346576 RepID=UPI0036604009